MIPYFLIEAEEVENCRLLHVCQRFGTTNDGAILADIARTTVDSAHDRTVQTYRTIAVDGSYYMAILEYLIVAYTTFDMVPTTWPFLSTSLLRIPPSMWPPT